MDIINNTLLIVLLSLIILACYPRIWLMIAIMILAGIGYAQAEPRKHLESWYEARWCTWPGKTSVTLSDGTEADCLKDGYAIEFDFADRHKTYEAYGQAKHYARMTKKKMGVVLIVEKWKQAKYVTSFMNDIIYHKDDIMVWVIWPDHKLKE